MSYIEQTMDQKMEQILRYLPQQKPFRYVDRLTKVEQKTIVGEYTFREDEWFYSGHFPGQPITPGVILLECMAQIGLAGIAIHLWLESNRDPSERITFFQSAEVNFHRPVLPGEKVIVMGENILFKMGKVKSNVQMRLADETLVASGTLTGMGVKKA